MNSLSVAELWSRRYLATYLSVNQVKARYKQTALGFGWAVVRPLVLVITFTFLFGAVANLPTENVPYPLFVFAGVWAWDLFSNTVTNCTSSIISNRAIVDRVYCPRLILPISGLMVAGFDFMITTALFAFMFVFYGWPPSYHILLAPVLILGVGLFGLSVGLWLAAIAVWFRDVRFFVAYVLQLLMMLSPVGYAAANIPAKFQLLVALNPMAVLIEGLRWSVLGTTPPSPLLIAVAAVELVVAFASALWFFTTVEKTFADVL